MINNREEDENATESDSETHNKTPEESVNDSLNELERLNENAKFFAEAAKKSADEIDGADDLNFAEGIRKSVNEKLNNADYATTSSRELRDSIESFKPLYENELNKANNLITEISDYRNQCNNYLTKCLDKVAKLDKNNYSGEEKDGKNEPSNSDNKMGGKKGFRLIKKKKRTKNANKKSSRIYSGGKKKLTTKKSKYGGKTHKKRK